MIGNQRDSFWPPLRNRDKTTIGGKFLPTLGNLFPEGGEGNYSNVLSGQQIAINGHIMPFLEI